MTTKFWQDRLERTPGIRPWLLRVARHSLSGKAEMPATITLGEIPQDKALRNALDEIFGGCQESGNRLRVRLQNTMRQPARWQPLAELLDLANDKPDHPPQPDTFERTVQRLRLIYPTEENLIVQLRNSLSLRRFLTQRPTAEHDLINLFETLLYLRLANNPTTLSELGARFFNDSKILRTGQMRAQLENLLRLQDGNPEADTTTLLNSNNIIDNPYTTHAVIFAPLEYQTADGVWLDWPATLWQRGEAATLSWESVRSITAIRLTTECREIISSENAAPFHRLVELGQPAIYTEGYPNAAVRSLVAHLAKASIALAHWGDTDLDGYLIAAQLSRHTTLRLLIDTPTLQDHLAQHTPLTTEQHHRLTTFIATHPDFPWLPHLNHTLTHGWLEQEQTIAKSIHVSSG